MARNVVPNYLAAGDINPSRFVTAAISLDFAVTQSLATEYAIGVSQAASRLPQMGQFGASGVSTLAAPSGSPIDVYGAGEECSLELGGTVLAGDFLKPTTGGKGITATVGTDKIGAQALQAGVSGDIIRVVVHKDSP